MFQLNRTCHYDNKTKTADSDEVDRKLANLDYSKLADIASFANAFDILNFAFITQEMSFVKCWWSGIEIDCNDYVLTVFTDNICTVGYAINLDVNMAKFFLGNESGKQT